MPPEFFPNQPIEVLISQAQIDFASWNVLRFEDWPNMIRSEPLRMHMELMKQSRGGTLDGCAHMDFKVRIGAIWLISEFWTLDEDFAGPVLKLAFEDPESCVRGAALCALPGVQKFISDPRHWLETIVRTARRRAVINAYPNPFQAAKEMNRHFDAQCRRECEELVGAELFEEMQKSLANLSLFFSHPDPNVRLAAIKATSFFRAQRKLLANEFQKLVLDDPEIDVRCLALEVWIACQRTIRDPNAGEILAQLVADTFQPTKIRQRAYHGLSVLAGVSRKDRPSLRPIGDQEFANNVDWSLLTIWRYSVPGE
jgi:hypothetical protein